MRVLGALRRLTWLDLSGCAGITDDGVSALKGLTLLRDLRLADCERLTNRSLATLAVLGELRELDLSNCVRITQVGRLRSLSRLSSIDLSGFPTPDAGLKSKQRRIRPPWKTRPLESKPDQVFECCNNLKILGMQLMIYRQKHQDRYPPLRSLLSVQPQASLRRCCFVSSRHGRVSRGYGWTSHPIRSMKDASQRPVAWCRGGIHKGGWRPVVFLDGHVERVTEKQFREDIARLDKRVARMEQAGRGSLHDH